MSTLESRTEGTRKRVSAVQGTVAARRNNSRLFALAPGVTALLHRFHRDPSVYVVPETYVIVIDLPAVGAFPTGGQFRRRGSPSRTGRLT